MARESLLRAGAPTRRTMLAYGAAFGCTTAFAARPARMVEIAPGVFVRRGVDGEADGGNRDAIANAGFVIGSLSVLVTDPGGSHADGAWLRAEIARRTALPVRHVVVSHGHPDHDFGASAFLADAPAFVGHRRLLAVYAARGDHDRARLAQVLGAQATGTLVPPTVTVTEGAPLRIDLGQRTVIVTAHPIAHSPADLTLHDDASGLLFAGDLLFVGRVPAVDGSVRGWIAVLTALLTEGATRAVPGHGPVVVPFAPAAAPLLRYLTRLRDDTRAAIAQGLSIDQAVATVGRAERDSWRLFDAYHGRNVTMAYKELEWE